MPTHPDDYAEPTESAADLMDALDDLVARDLPDDQVQEALADLARAEASLVPLSDAFSTDAEPTGYDAAQVPPLTDDDRAAMSWSSNGQPVLHVVDAAGDPVALPDDVYEQLLAELDQPRSSDSHDPLLSDGLVTELQSHGVARTYYAPAGVIHQSTSGEVTFGMDWARDADSYTNVGKWDGHYAQLDPDHPDHYIDTPTYQAGVDWLAPIIQRPTDLVEDWGCGKGWFQYVVEHQPGAQPFAVYGIDGSRTPFAHRQEDLATQDRIPLSVPGIFMRGVAEHDYRWRDILTQLAYAFERRALVVFFTPMVDGPDHELLYVAPGYGDVPNLSLPTPVVNAIFTAAGCEFTAETVPSDCVYGQETVYRLWKDGHGPTDVDRLIAASATKPLDRLSSAVLTALRAVQPKGLTLTDLSNDVAAAMQGRPSRDMLRASLADLAASGHVSDRHHIGMNVTLWTAEAP